MHAGEVGGLWSSDPCHETHHQWAWCWSSPLYRCQAKAWILFEQGCTTPPLWLEHTECSSLACVVPTLLTMHWPVWEVVFRSWGTMKSEEQQINNCLKSVLLYNVTPMTFKMKGNDRKMETLRSKVNLCLRWRCLCHVNCNEMYTLKETSRKWLSKGSGIAKKAHLLGYTLRVQLNVSMQWKYKDLSLRFHLFLWNSVIIYLSIVCSLLF